MKSQTQYSHKQTQTEIQLQTPEYFLTLNPLKPSPTGNPTSNQFYFQSFTLYCELRGKDSNISQHADYRMNITPITTLTSLEEFFEYFTSLKKPSSLKINRKIMLFHSNCRPFWEEWIDSGCLLIDFKNKPEQEQFLDLIWEYLAFSLVGNNIDPEVIGISVETRNKLILLQIWLRKDGRAIEVGYELQKQIKKELSFAEVKGTGIDIKIKYKKHVDSIKGHSTIRGAQNLTQVKVKKMNGLNNSF